MAHLHSIYDSDLHFVIDPDTRVITNQMENKNSVIQFDHNSERLTFELPRYVEEHDMLSCNRVEVHYLNIEAKTGDQNIGIYEVQDLQVSPHDDKVVICSWLVSNNATKYAGTLNFVLRFACVTNQVDYIWNTAVFKNFAIQNGLYNSEPVVEQYADVLAEWYQSLFTASADGVTSIQEARAAAIMAVDAVANERIADIEQAGSDVIASLPPEYLELVEDVAPPIVETATGEAIAITDSANRRLRGLTLYGKSTQDGTPTPEAPVEIESVVEPTVRVCGKNLWNHDYDTVDMSALSGWGSAIWRSEDVVKVLKPNTTYTMRFVVTCLSVPEYESVFSEDCGFVLYSAQESGKFIRMAMSQDEGAFSVGDRRIATCTFTTPVNVRDTSMGYEILRYVQRYKQADGTAVYATAKFEEVQ
jgi:tetrahydromethanopterin S-methyltransferase subunit B